MVNTKIHKQGINGWLIIFIIQIFLILFLSALRLINALILQNQYTNPTFLKFLIFLLYGSFIFLIILDLRLLFKLKPQAIKLSKIILVLYPIITIPYVFFIGLYGSLTGPILNQANIPTLIRPFITLIIWYLYLNNSIRIKNTYSPKNNTKLNSTEKALSITTFVIGILLFLSLVLAYQWGMY